jgi:hypothetical protein
MDFLKKIDFSILFLVLIFFILVISVFSVYTDSLVVDEREHLGSAIYFGKHHLLGWNAIHPPFIKILVGIFSHHFFEDKNLFNILPNQPIARSYCLEILKSANAKNGIFVARLVIIFLNTFLLYLAYYFLSKQISKKDAFFTIALYATSITYLAHSRHILFDASSATLVFIVFCTWINFYFTRNYSYLYLSLFFLLVGALIKFSTLFIIPVLFIICITPLDKKSISYNLSSLLKFTCFFAVLSFLILWVGKFFIIVDSGILSWQIQKISSQFIILSGVLNSNFFNLFPDTVKLILIGLIRLFDHIFVSNNSYSFFLGEFYSGSKWYVLPTLFSLKENALFIGSILFATILTIKSLCIDSIKIEKTKFSYILFRKYSLIFIGIFSFFVFLSQLNLGIRYLLPVIPFFTLLIVLTVNHYKKPIFLNLLLICNLLTMIFVYPYYISYFNIFHKLFSEKTNIALDSNFDWGQDLIRLQSTLDKYKITKFHIDYSGGDSVERIYGNNAINWNAENGFSSNLDWFVVSIWKYRYCTSRHIDNVGYFYNDKCLWLNKFKPIDIGGQTLLLFRNTN